MNDVAKAGRTPERRRFYLIRDVVELRYHVLGDDESADRQGDDAALGSGQLLERLDEEIAEAINRVWGVDPVTAQALGLMNRKISILASLSLTGDRTEPVDYEEACVSLSGAGIAFGAAEPLATGARLRLQLVLHPSRMELAITARVVGSEARDDADRPYWIRLDFENDPQANRLLSYAMREPWRLTA